MCCFIFIGCKDLGLASQQAEYKIAQYIKRALIFDSDNTFNIQVDKLPRLPHFSSAANIRQELKRLTLDNPANKAQLQFKQSQVTKHVATWLELFARLGNPDAQFKLAKYLKSGYQASYFQLSSNQSSSNQSSSNQASSYQTSSNQLSANQANQLLVDEPLTEKANKSTTASHYWLTKAIEQNYLPALRFRVSQLIDSQAFSELDNFVKANTFSEQERQIYQLYVAVGLAEPYWQAMLQRVLARTDIRDEFLLSLKQRISLLVDEYSNPVSSAHFQNGSACQLMLHVYAKNPWQLKALDSLLNETINQTKLKLFNICIASYRWGLGATVQGKEMQEKDRQGKEIQRKNKRSKNTQHVAEQAESSVTAITPPYTLTWQAMPQKKKSYVQGRGIYLNQQADRHVLKHEIGHLLGFEDEYELASQIKARVCQLPKDQQVKRLGANVVIIDKALSFANQQQALDFIQHSIPWAGMLREHLDWNNWLVKQGERFVLQIQSGSLELEQSINQSVGLFASQTCHGSSVQAIKPWANVSFMELHTQPITRNYRSLLAN
ncbi:hypothetical protein C2869_11890 [Saccharobesus litoralis]|uniref:Uncharacterized protein n=1 Tax=Saccharobesus litoralis TaxID=2172099 RepID=A0A2S0VSA5_9ALTE|nr:hypothetical protein C2869_11890 [Saccharobesus litoralis]